MMSMEGVRNHLGQVGGVVGSVCAESVVLPAWGGGGSGERFV